MTSTTTDLAEWLGRYGLGQYAQMFDENNIELAVLPDLTENDLKNLGVSLGHRKILLRAIGALTAANQSSGATTAERTVYHSQDREAELRQITVLFCDLVGSTQLSVSWTPRISRYSLTRIGRSAAQRSGAMEAMLPNMPAMA